MAAACSWSAEFVDCNGVNASRFRLFNYTVQMPAVVNRAATLRTGDLVEDRSRRFARVAKK
jgi:hypothetical protein